MFKCVFALPNIYKNTVIITRPHGVRFGLKTDIFFPASLPDLLDLPGHSNQLINPSFFWRPGFSEDIVPALN